MLTGLNRLWNKFRGRDPIAHLDFEEPKVKMLDFNPATTQKRDIYELGKFEGAVWVFFEEFQMPDGNICKTIDMSEMEFPPGVTLEDVVHAMTDPRAIVQEWDGTI